MILNEGDLSACIARYNVKQTARFDDFTPCHFPIEKEPYSTRTLSVGKYVPTIL